METTQLMPATAKRFGAFEPFDVEQNIAAGTRYVTALMWEFHGDLRLVAAAYYAGDRNIARKQLDYRNPDVVAYVQAVRRQYMLRRYPAVRPSRRSTPLGFGSSRLKSGFRFVSVRVTHKLVNVSHCHDQPEKPRHHLRREFVLTIRMPDEITSVILGSPGEFKAEDNEGQPHNNDVKPIVKEAAQSNLLIATKSGQHVTTGNGQRRLKCHESNAAGGFSDRIQSDAELPHFRRSRIPGDPKRAD